MESLCLRLFKAFSKAFSCCDALNWQASTGRSVDGSGAPYVQRPRTVEALPRQLCLFTLQPEWLLIVLVGQICAKPKFSRASEFDQRMSKMVVSQFCQDGGFTTLAASFAKAIV